MRNVFYFIFLVLFSFSCNTGKDAFDPNKKYSQQQLKQDYTIFRNILQDSHPSLYWYTTKDSLKHYFDSGYASIKDSMSLPQFRSLLSYTISKINCGHTSVRYSKKYTR
ncbi:MAG: peptidase S41, partial [Bacteroidetes bacterium]|nr:peptidase S41 [Bacteroidota bacterium]